MSTILHYSMCIIYYVIHHTEVICYFTRHVLVNIRNCLSCGCWVLSIITQRVCRSRFYSCDVRVISSVIIGFVAGVNVKLIHQ